MNTEIMKIDNNEIEGQLMGVTSTFCSVKAETPEEKRALFNAMNNPEFRVEQFINQTIYVKDVFAELVDIMDKNTGEFIQAARIVLIDDEGTGYACVSKGIFHALKKLFKLYGAPTWNEPIGITIKQIRKSNNMNILTFDLA